MLELYDFEACPYCRKVREALSELDLDYIERPTAQGSPRRAELKKLGGKVQVPFLIDRNTGTQLYESDDIIAYLNEHYGAGKRAGWSLPLPSFVDDVVSAAASLPRLGHGRSCRTTPERDGLEPLVLYNMEGSPYCRKVRETLCEIDLDYVVRNVPKGSPQRADLKERGGKVQVPYLIDPNTGSAMYESDDIIAYLEETYGN
ncbi:MAG: glutathione S-transferase N-terminal domain-containing protein [Deltaproteobacteria bacterium]|nr:glutathione S-transferase N-terminal domain-containing protein [Deltaproteobacteria bacterium]